MSQDPNLQPGCCQDDADRYCAEEGWFEAECYAGPVGSEPLAAFDLALTATRCMAVAFGHASDAAKAARRGSGARAGLAWERALDWLEAAEENLQAVKKAAPR